LRIKLKLSFMICFTFSAPICIASLWVAFKSDGLQSCSQV